MRVIKYGPNETTLSKLGPGECFRFDGEIFMRTRADAVNLATGAITIISSDLDGFVRTEGAFIEGPPEYIDRMIALANAKTL